MGKKKGKGKAKKADAGGGEEPTPAEQLEHALTANQKLTVELALRRDEARQAILEKRELRAKVDDLAKDFKQEEEDTFHITADMTRQYKAMQDELLKRINEGETTIITLNNELDQAKLAHIEMERQKDAVIAQKEAEIQEMKAKMDEMAGEFGDMLKETLDKMSDRIEVANTSWDGDNGIPIEQRLQEYNMK